MRLTPVNNYLTVRAVEDTDTEDSGILLPQDYRAVESPFAVVEVVNCSGENGTLWGAGLQLVVEAHMLRRHPAQRRDLHRHQGKPRNRHLIG